MSKTESGKANQVAEVINQIPDAEVRNNFVKIMSAAVELSAIMTAGSVAQTKAS